MEPPRQSALSSGLNIKTSKNPLGVTCGRAQARNASLTAKTTQSIPKKTGDRTKSTALRSILKKTGSCAPLRSAKEGIDYSALPTMRSLNKRLARATLNAKRSNKKETKGTTIRLAPAKPRSTFPFLSLPPELRDLVYQQIAGSTPVTLPGPPRKCKLVGRSSLLSTSRQIRDEFLGVLDTHATPIMTTVVDFNFSHIIRFLDHLSDRELHALPTVDAPSSRQFCIRLVINERCPPNPEGLQAWLLRCENPDKKGSQVATKYILHHDQVPLLAKHTQHHWMSLLSEEYRGLRGLMNVRDKIDGWLKKLEPCRLRDEARKIREAMTIGS
ncbi:unnamed protein product [Zymoseptoria tritici ST99CH_1A5]|uniref:F-box domain-containing protein n=1 Tax=Zymoseptoria tritici ST99CH_1A5 TaxID=1276529 RepID=A0A1Y6L7P0_ZYMTR|nr:unnamed protein product [Zymoseptoria tritici ST99CH_1A5]